MDIGHQTFIWLGEARYALPLFLRGFMQDGDPMNVFSALE
jgi:hypothetical protein